MTGLSRGGNNAIFPTRFNLMTQEYSHFIWMQLHFELYWPPQTTVSSAHMFIQQLIEI